jgi:protein SCO1/2
MLILRRCFQILALSASLLVLAACSEQKGFMGSDITGGGIGAGWSLTDHTGAVRTSESFPGKVALVFFGFTQCPDICPASLAEVATAVKLLGDRAKDVQVLMVSVDPERDTPEVLKDYLGAFDAELPTRFLGLTGSQEEVRKAASSFRAFYAKSPRPGGDYTMDHSTSFYLIDSKGATRVLLSNRAGPEAMAHDIRALLN